jgi:hypothetical protein
MKKTQLAMKFNKQTVTKERIKAVCDLINTGNSPSFALKSLGMTTRYVTPLLKAGIIYKHDKGYTAVKKLYIEKFEQFKELEIKSRSTAIPTMQAHAVKRNWLIRFFLYLFKLINK